MNWKQCLSIEIKVDSVVSCILLVFNSFLIIQSISIKPTALANIHNSWLGIIGVFKEKLLLTLKSSLILKALLIFDLTAIMLRSSKPRKVNTMDLSLYSIPMEPLIAGKITNQDKAVRTRQTAMENKIRFQYCLLNFGFVLWNSTSSNDYLSLPIQFSNHQLIQLSNQE